MNKEKEKMPSHKTASTSSHKTSEKRPSSTGSSAAKKVVSKTAASKQAPKSGSYKPATNELNRRTVSRSAKRTVDSEKASSKPAVTRKRKKKKEPPKILKNLPAALRFALKLSCVILGLVVIVAVATAVSGWSVGDIISHSAQAISDWKAMQGSGEDFPVTLSGSLSVKQEKLASGIAVLTDTSLTVYSKNGNTARNQAHFMANPALAAEGNYAVVYDIGGDRWRFETAAKTLCTGEADYSIVSASVARSGYFVLVCSDDERHSAIYVYNRSGSKVFGWKSADYYITTAALSANGSYLTVCGLNAEGGILKSAVITFDVFGKKEIAREAFSDSLLLDVRYLKSGKAVVIGENSILTVSENGKKISVSHLNDYINSYDFDYDSGVVYCTSAVEGSLTKTLTALDTKGRERFSEEITCNVTDVCISSDYVCVLSQGFGALYTIGGKQIKEFDVTVDAKKIAIIKDKAYILCNTVLRRESF